MPLARIITKYPDEALELAMQLRSRGFVVETVDPDQAPELVPDLEIQLDSYDADRVLNRILESSSEEISVFVAPGSIDSTAPSLPSSRARSFEPPDLQSTATGARFESLSAMIFEAQETAEHSFAPSVQRQIFSSDIAQTRVRSQKDEHPVVAASSTEPSLIRIVDDEPEQQLARSLLTVPAPEAIEPAVPPQEPIIVSDSVASVDKNLAILEAPSTESRDSLHGGNGAGLNGEALDSDELEFVKEPVRAMNDAPLVEAESFVEPIPAEESEAEFVPAQVRVQNSNPPSGSAELEIPDRVRAQETVVVGAASSRKKMDFAFWRVAVVAAALAVFVVIAGSAWQQKRAAATVPLPPAQSSAQKPPAVSAASPSPAPNQGKKQPPAPSNASSSAPVSSPKPSSAAGPAKVNPPTDSANLTSQNQPTPVLKQPSVKAKPAAHHHPTSHSGDGGLVAKDTVVYFDRKPATSASKAK